ncbi:MAG: NAD(P)H-hydrate epimerase [Bacillota bacterium]|nr:NAD(P)H-hydrate epimerase [Bacillota bacterium]
MSKHFVTCERMKELERLTDERGISYYQMMENAGTGAFAEIMSRSGVCRGQSAVVFCGKGNNGGDGFVVARKLCQTGLVVTVVLVDGEPVTEDAKENFRLLLGMPVPVQILDMTTGFEVAVEMLKEPTKEPDLLIDAIYGTGFYGELRPSAKTAAGYITRFRNKAYALDIPSGLCGDMKEGDTINADSAKVAATITFHAPKPVHLIPAAQEYCGEIRTVNIGIHE